jgi:DNA-binding MarR family transcriptional regulator
MAGQHTLDETERQVQARLGDLKIDFEAMAVASNLFRAANSVRNYLERTVLAEHDLSWTAFVVLWVVWIWEPVESRVIAEEGGFSKATLTGVMQTLEGRGLITRTRSSKDGRLVLVKLTAKGRKMMMKLFPEFNKGEQLAVADLKRSDLGPFADLLRAVTITVDSQKLVKP